jgi:hypothetical protein
MTGSEPRNESEGNRTAGRWYNGAQHRFVQSGQVEEEAHEGRKGDGSSEKRGMERAEKIGKRHITREVRNSPESNSSHRAIPPRRQNRNGCIRFSAAGQVNHVWEHLSYSVGWQR